VRPRLSRETVAAVVVVAVVLAIANYVYIDIFDKVGVNPGVMR